jgi:hypothetical protein
MVTPIRKDQKGLYHSNLVAIFEIAERRDALVARVTKCVGQAFHAIGSSSETQEIVYWNLLMTKNVRRSEIIDKPEEFIEGLRAIYGEAGTVVFEHLLRREIGREFELSASFDKEPINEKTTSELLHLIAYTALESQGGS